jgi:hypothetical protein
VALNDLDPTQRGRRGGVVGKVRSITRRVEALRDDYSFMREREQKALAAAAREIQYQLREHAIDPWDEYLNTLQPCPACATGSIYSALEDRYFHFDGTDNQRCWRSIATGRSA